MASKNVVTLTFAGDSTDLDKTLDRVGEGANELAREVDKASDRIDSGFGRMGSGLDAVDDKASRAEAGFRGTMDVMSAMGEFAEGNVLQGLTDLGGGIADLAQGLGGILVPALQKSVKWLAQTRVGMLAQAAASKVVAAATTLWSGAQRVLNAVLATNPIFLVIGAIAALVAIIVVIEKRTGFFSDLWHKVWERIGDPIKAVWEWISETFWPGIRDVLDGVVDRARGVWEGIRDAFGRVLEFIGSLPGRIASAARGMFDGVRDAFKAAINWIIDHWNNFRFTIGPVRTVFGQIGPWHLDTPDIPRLAEGGIVTRPTLAMVGERGPEAVIPLRRDRGAAAGSPTVVLRVDGSRASRLLAELFREALRTNPGFRAEVHAA